MSPYAINRKLEANGLKAKNRKVPAASARCPSIISLITSMFARDASLMNRRRMIVRASFASITLPAVAAAAPISATPNGLYCGCANPIHDKTIQVGGANAGTTFSVKMSTT